MKPLLFRITVICLLSFCSILQVFAAGKEKGITTKKASASVEIPFDANVDKLPAKFQGNHFFVIYSALIKNYGKYQKSEFETNNTFQERLRKLDAAPLTGKLKYDSTIAFSLLTSIKTSYDADSQNMTVIVPLTSVHNSDLYNAISYELPPGKGIYSHISETVNGNAIEVFTHRSATKKYTGSNAFGMKIKITGNVYDTFAVAVRNDNNLMKHGSSITLNIPISPDKAREAKAAGNIVLVGNLLYPYVGNGTSHSSATIDSPIETFDRIRYIAMELTGIWYYNVKNGEVFYKEKINSNSEE